VVVIRQKQMPNTPNDGLQRSHVRMHYGVMDKNIKSWLAIVNSVVFSSHRYKMPRYVPIARYFELR